jgi:hypothetical protein
MPDVVARRPPTEAREVIAAWLPTSREQRGEQPTAHASQSEGGEVDESALTICIASCEKLEELGYSVEERSAELEIVLLEDGSPYDGDVLVSPADFLSPGAVSLNELAVVMGFRPVREEKVCCAFVQHRPKEGSRWWRICGGTGSHSHQGLNFCGRHQQQWPSGAMPGTAPRFFPPPPPSPGMRPLAARASPRLRWNAFHGID